MTRQKADSVVTLTNKPQIIISPFVHELIRRLHKKYPGTEWSGIARLQKGDGVWTMTDLIFGEQENSATLTTITEKGTVEVLEKIIEADSSAIGEYNCWVHSHHSMSVFWSGTDDSQKQSFDNGGVNHFWHVVTNYKGKDFEPGYKGALTIYKPVNIEYEVDVSAGGTYDDCVALCGDAEQSIVEMKRNWITELESVDASASALTLEMDTEIAGLESQPMDSIVSADDIAGIASIINVAGAVDEISSSINQTVEARRQTLINATRASYAKKIKELSSGIDTKYNDAISELIEACLPFNAKIADIEKCIASGRKTYNKYNPPLYGGNGRDYVSKSRNKANSRDKTPNALGSRDVPLRPGYDSTDSLAADPGAWDVIDDVIRNNMGIYLGEYSRYSDTEGYDVTTPRGFEKFTRSGNYLYIEGEYIKITEIRKSIANSLFQ